MTLRRRLLLLLLPALAVLMLAGAFVDRRVATISTQDAYDQALASAAFAVAADLQVDGGAGRRLLGIPALLRDVEGDGGTDTSARDLAITGPGGALIAGDADLARLALARTPGADGGPLFQDARLRGRAVRLASVEVPFRGKVATVTIAETRARRERTQRVMLLGKLLLDFAELDMTLLVVWAAVYFGLHPLGRLREQAEAHSRRELQRFDETGVPGELRALVAAFNRVLELLHDAATAQRRFVADAAHQMRTPVAGLLAQIELLQSEPLSERAVAQLASLQRAAQSLAHAANQLLSLARAEPASALDGQFETVALDALVRDLVERHVTRADQAGIDLGAEACAATVSGDAWLLEDLLANLIDNALKYTPRGGRVTVRCGVEGGVDGEGVRDARDTRDAQAIHGAASIERAARGQPWLEVEDDGPGIPEAERGRVRERFYRRPGSPGYGAGLGLAIVEEIARLHQASLTIGAGPDGRGARLRVSFHSAALIVQRSRPDTREASAARAGGTAHAEAATVNAVSF